MRLLFSAGAGYSHIAPMLPLAVTARQHGHEVLFVTGPDAVRHCTAAGLPAAGVGTTLADSASRYVPTVQQREQLAAMSTEQRLSHMVAHYLVGIGAAERLDDMLGTVREFRPDLVVSNLAERAAVLAANILGLPYVMHAIGPPKTAAVMAEGWRIAGEIAQRHGLAELPARDAVPYLDIWPDGLRPDGVAWEYPTRWPLRPENVLPANGNPPEILNGLPYEHTAYVTLGTTHNNRPGALESIVDGLADDGVNLVVTIGWGGDRERFGTPPAHVRIAEFVPQEELLPHVDVVLCHAGAGTVLGALAAGVPLVVSPLATDQFDMADQVVAAGAGERADGPSAQTVRAAFHTVRASAAHRAAAGRIAGQLAALPAPAVVLDRLVARYAR